MYTVTDAKFVQMVEQNGAMMAEVEVSVAERNDGLKVYLYPTENGYEAAQVLSNDADYDLDWYDNDLHQAFSDISDKVLNSASTDASGNSFVNQVLAMDGVQTELARQYQANV